MAEDKSYNEIRNTAEDWEFDDRNKLPYSGKSVQTFIKKGIDKADVSYEERIGDSYFDSSTYTIYLFKTTEDKEAWLGGDTSIQAKRVVLNFTGTQRQMKVINGMESLNLYFTTTGDTAEITFGFLSQEKEITATEWSDVPEDALISVSVDKGGVGEFVDIMSNQLLLSGKTMTIDVKKYLATGSNRVRVTAVGAQSGAEGKLQYQVNLTSMYLSPSNFAWNTPFIEGKEYNLGGMNIGGAIDKKLFVKVTNEGGYYKLYEKNLGTSTYITNAYFFKELEFPSAGTGVYNVELWLDASGLESEHLSYNIICVAAADETTARLVCISNIADKAINYADNILFQYAVYNGGAAKGTPHIKITAVVNTNPLVLKDEDLVDVDTNTKLSYNFHLEVETDENDLQLTSLLSFGNEQARNFVIDNSASYPSTSGAVFYMNAANRSNTQSNKKNIVNEVTKGTVACDWTNMSFDGLDGWTVDEENRKCLTLQAGSTASIHYQPLASVGSGKTIEFNYKVSNVADYKEPIISICDDPSNDRFRGIRILPKKVVLHSRDKNTADYVQSYDLMDEQYVNLLITIVRNYKTNYGNIAIIYVNGVKKCEFEFENADSWDVASNILLGSGSADLSVYTIRVYNSGFGLQDTQKNYISSLNTSKDKADAYAKMYNILDDSFNVDYDKVYGIYNTMVVELLGGAELPHYGLSKEYTAQSNLELNILNEDADKPAISGVYLNTPVGGQGTTSMNYFRWNLRWKKTPIRITAKKNYASSMHSHKMGACGAFNDLHNLVVGENEAGARVAVYQYPAFGFLKTLVDGTTDQYNYQFIGLFTVGPDKGDKPTFGYKHADYKDTVISLEGTDHSIKGVGFDYPWSELKYVESEESICVDKGNNNYEAAWEVSVCGNKNTEAEKQAYLDTEFGEAYKAVYDNSVMIMGTSESLATINADVTAWGERKDSTGREYQFYEFWIDGEYDLYYLSKKTNTYVKNGVNLLTQLGISESELGGLSIEDKNNLFIAKRVERFRGVAANYFHIDDLLFCYAFLFIFGCSDNFKKNFYPYKFATLANGGRYRMRQDDMDTLADIDNQNLSTKTFSIELEDFTDDTKTAFVFKGEDSVLLQNFLRAFPTEFKQMGKRILAAMYELSETGTSTIDRLTGFFDKYFWKKAQLYFPKSAYNTDAEYSYEEAWPPYKSGEYKVDVHPLSQSRGDHYEAERDWFINRLIYVSSKFGYGPFAQYNDSALGVISFRTQLAQDFTLTPAIDLYPTIHSGQSAVLASTERVKAGESVTLKGAGGSNTNVYIKGADLLSDIGDLSTLAVDAANASIAVASKRLQKIKIGDEVAENVTSNLASINIGDCPSLMLVDARNLASLSGTVDLTQCPRLREAYFGGTDVRAISLANGSKLTKLQLPNALTQISMQNLKFLEGTGLDKGDLSNVEFYRVENCPHLDAFGMLKELYNAESKSLRNIRVIGFVYDGDATDVDMVMNLAKDVAADGSTVDYTGIDSEGTPQQTLVPIIEGTLNIAGSVYADSAEFVREQYPNLVLNVTGGYYIRFADKAVQDICVANWGDGTGITEAQAAAVTSLSTSFKGNTVIETFDELEKFTGLTSIYGRDHVNGNVGAFENCTSLKQVTLPLSVTTLGGWCFKGCTALETIENLEQITSIGAAAFKGCTSLKKDLYFPNLTALNFNGNFSNYQYFVNSGITGFFAPNLTTGQASSDGGSISWFNGCTELKRVNLGKVDAIACRAFAGCSSLEEVLGIQDVVTLGPNAFYGCANLIQDIELPKCTSILSTNNYGNSSAFGKSGITSLSIPLVTSVGEGGSNNNGFCSLCSNLTRVEFGNALTVIGPYAFQGCTSLNGITLPPSLTTIGGSAFSGCTSLEIADLSLPNLTSLGQNAFYGVSIRKISNLGKITSLPNASSSSQNFGKKDILEEIVLPETLTSFSSNSIRDYPNLTSVGSGVFPNVTSIGYNAFYNILNVVQSVSFPALTSIVSTSASGQHLTLSKCGFTEFHAPLLDLANTGVYQSGYGVLTNCPNLRIIEIGKLTVVPFGFAMGCTSLENVSDLSKVTTVQYMAFRGTSSLTIHLSLPVCTKILASTANGRDGVFAKSGIRSLDAPMLLEIGKDIYAGGSVGAFQECPNLTLVKLRDVTTIGMNAFYKCPNLTRVVIDNVTPPTLGSGAFAQANDNLAFYVPDSAVDIYKEASGWTTYASRIKPLSEYVE